METTQILDLEILENPLAEIVTSVVSAMLRSEAFPMPLLLAENPLQAAVYVTGPWCGGVLMECDGETAKNFCSRLMRIPRPASVDADVLDSLGELASMIGGNLKSMLPPGCVLSLPLVNDGSGPELRMGSKVETSRSFDGPEGPFLVTLFQATLVEIEPDGGSHFPR